jgi:hypothetical protein
MCPTRFRQFRVMELLSKAHLAGANACFYGFQSQFDFDRPAGFCRESFSFNLGAWRPVAGYALRLAKAAHIVAFAGSFRISGTDGSGER